MFAALPWIKSWSVIIAAMPRLILCPKSGRVKMTAIIVLLAGMVVTGCLFAWSHLQFITLNYQISQIYNEQKELQNMNRKLRVELTNLKSLARLERLAKENYNMATPEPRQVVNLR